jgi:hypothetical protein
VSSQYNGVAGNISANLPAALAIASSTNASPIAVTTSVNHGLTTGDEVVVYQHQTNTAANGTWVAVVTGAKTLTLTGSTGNGVGGATGSLQSFSMGPTFQIPSDGDARSAASSNVGSCALGDRTAFLGANTGPYRVLSLWGAQVDDNATESTIQTSYTFTAAHTWLSVVGLISPAQGILQAGDIIDATFTCSIRYVNTNNDGIGFLLALGAGFSTAGNLPGSSAKIPGSGQIVPVDSTNADATGVTLTGRITVPANVQTCEFFLYAYTRSASYADISFTQVGDYAMTGCVWRPTAFSGRTG